MPGTGHHRCPGYRPVNKQNMQQPGFSYAGHTEYLQERFRTDEVVMFMVSDLLKVGLVAGHVPLPASAG